MLEAIMEALEVAKQVRALAYAHAARATEIAQMAERLEQDELANAARIARQVERLEKLHDRVDDEP